MNKVSPGRKQRCGPFCKKTASKGGRNGFDGAAIPRLRITRLVVSRTGQLGSTSQSCWHHAFGGADCRVARQRWPIVARTGGLACRLAGTWAIASPAGITVLKLRVMAWSRMCPPLNAARWLAVLEQDRILLENLAPEASAYEYLYQHDVGLSRLRRMMQKTAKVQVAKREAQHALR